MTLVYCYREKELPTADQVIARLEAKENKRKRKRFKDNRHGKRQQPKPCYQVSSQPAPVFGMRVLFYGSNWFKYLGGK